MFTSFFKKTLILFGFLSSSSYSDAFATVEKLTTPERPNINMEVFKTLNIYEQQAVLNIMKDFMATKDPFKKRLIFNEFIKNTEEFELLAKDSDSCAGC